MVPHTSDVNYSVPVNNRYVASSNRERIIVADNDPQVLLHLREILSGHGYKVLGTDRPNEMMHMVDTKDPDLVLLDVMVAGTSGFALMKSIREVSGTPIIFLSASDRDRLVIKAFELGADDYITKPFSSAELLARVAAALRRRKAGITTEPRRPLRFGDLTIDYECRDVSVSERSVQLSAIEYKLLSELSINAGRVMTRDQILQRVWGSGYSGERELLRATIKNLRRKLGDNANAPQYIFTERRVGYRMPKPQADGAH